MPIDTLNRYMVAANSKGVMILKPPVAPMSGEAALTLAAWLVALAPVADLDSNEQDARTRFLEILTAVENT